MRHFVNVLQKHAQKKSDQQAILYLEDGQTETADLSYAELDKRAKAVAGYLQSKQMQGERVMLLYPAGVDFIIHLLGCWYAGVIGVPVQCPPIHDFAQQEALLKTIAEDADIAAVFVLEAYRSVVDEVFGRDVAIITDKQIKQHRQHYQQQPITDDVIAYLQYTSGSTSSPKAAVVTHGHLKHSLRETIKSWQYSKNSVTLNWAPHTHVYGLVCGLLVPLYHGTRAIIMPPGVVLANPLRWLKAVSHYRATHSGCPNFGYDLCIRHIKSEDIQSLDLRHWKVAVNGGDLVQAQTLKGFVEKFAEAGFSLAQFSSAYGMSELTGAIAVTPMGTEAQLFNHSRTIVSSGRLLGGLHAVAVDVTHHQPLEAGEVGEIWLSGPSVVNGYWRREAETKAVFDARIADDKRSYFRTGDLGFIRDNEIYLTGRLKEVIVVYGKKYYPLDLEITTAKAVTQFEINLPQVAFSNDVDGKPHIVIVQEVPNEPSVSFSAELTETIRYAITKTHGIDVHQVVLLPKGGIPKTNSGKLQRTKCLQLFVDHLLPSYEIVQDKPAQVEARDASVKAFIQLVAELLNLTETAIDMQAPLSRYAFDSVNMIQLTTLLNERYGLSLSPAALYAYSTLGAFYRDILEKRMDQSDIATQPSPDSSNDIAIIGMSARFPKAEDVNVFWDNLIHARDCIGEVPEFRWNWHDLTLKWGGFIDAIDQFDAAFFNISPREAALMDPQQRLFLETVWKTIEDAGYSPETLASFKTGLYVGVFNHDYAELVQKNEVMDAYLTTGIMNSMIANRISYVLNLKGPSEAIDTACSSSLVAIHQAVNAILQGDCHLAIAGGVNLLITPTSYIAAQQAGMLSEDGRCKTFDKTANGYVRGEGVGAILLKKLSHALADGDHVYGVIKGTAVNHGGHAASLTAPNPNAQAEAIVTACQRANISVTSIDYIETHGTGTPLGDPIEINGLKKAFQQLADEAGETLPHHYCGLGALKTHIGHLESAAGIASVIKLLLAMRHEQFPANLHFNTLNPYIDITHSPFYIVDHLKSWPVKPDGNPRRAGVSSFGFGGANAHVVLEASPFKSTSINQARDSDYLITLSAKSIPALRERMMDLLSWLENQSSLPDIKTLSYTLNVGRSHFDNRFGVVVDGVDVLRDVLHYLLLKDDFHAYVFEVSSAHQVGESLSSDLHTLCLHYLDGGSIHWSSIYGDYQEKIALPTYPFSKESHWLSVKPQAPHQAGVKTFSQQFKGDEFYLKAHQVNDVTILPGVVCLEMARIAAGMRSAREDVIEIRDVVWKKPIDQVALAHPMITTLQPQDDAFSFSVSDSAATAVYVTGAIRKIARLTSDEIIQPRPNALTQSPEDIYAYFKQIGIVYGEAFQVIQQLKYDDRSVWAELVLPDSLIATQTDFELHPALLDGVLQTTQALLRLRDVLYLPFSIGRMCLYAPLRDRCHVNVTLVSDMNSMAQPEFNILVTSLEGVTLLVITGFCLSAVIREQSTLAYYEPVWIEKALSASSPNSRSTLILGYDDSSIDALHAALGNDVPFKLITQIEWIEMLPDDVVVGLPLSETAFSSDRIEELLALTQTLVRRLMHLKPSRPLRMVFVSQEANLFSQALAGFAKTLQQEHAWLSCRYIETPDMGVLNAELAELDMMVKYDASKHRFIQRYQPIVQSETSQEQSLFRQNGVYLITGGMGGLGYIIATYLATHYQANLILSGRSSLSSEYQQKLAALESKGANAWYCQADVGVHESVQHLIQSSKARFGVIHGVIHAAGQLNDSYILNQTAEGSAMVLAPKVKGTCYLHAATLTEPLDCFILFSSVAALLGNAGQSDYAYANGFMDAFAAAREHERLSGRCAGRTISINWPLWNEGGMVIPQETQQLLAQTLGIVSLSTAQGLLAFEAVLRFNRPQIAVLPGYQVKLQEGLNQRSLTHTAMTNDEEFEFSHDMMDLLRAQTVAFLKETLAKAAQLPPEHLDPTTPLEIYGIDSLMIVQLNQTLARTFKALPSTLFYEYRTLDELASYFMTHQRSILASMFTVNGLGSMPMSKGETINPLNTSINSQDMEIAIIGIDGRYPEADNLMTFWENLKAGRDSVTEIPASRWHVSTYFDEDRDVSGKAYSKWGGFLNDVDAFDPLFFNISPREAALMDPQERLFLETAWKTIENAGYAREQLAGKKVGVYVGVMYGHYQLYHQASASETFVPTHSVFASIPNRVSYFFDFHGPSIALDTMCSSSLTAIHLACQSIRNGECELALAGGVNLSLHPNKYLLLSEGQFLASDGKCRSFGEGGDGYVPGEGVGAVLLKPLKQALLDRDPIIAVIKGSALNHGGKTHGYTVPNPNAQAALIAKAYHDAHMTPSMVSYIEAHGTGTALGDPIELAGLNKVFAQPDQVSHCAIGSVKSNIGHCESAAGIAAVSKVVLQLQHQVLVPSLHSTTLNEQINWKETPFVVQQTLQAWEKPAHGERIAGISAFGAGGANAHLIVAEAPERHFDVGDWKSHYVLTLSAKTEMALKQRLLDLSEWLVKNPELNLAHLSYTLNVGRSHFEYRCAMVVASLHDVRLALHQLSQEAQPLWVDYSHHDDYQTRLLKLAEAYLAKQTIDWQALYSPHEQQRMVLPSYPFAKERYWYSESPTTESDSSLSGSSHDLAQQVMSTLTHEIKSILKMTHHTLMVEKNLGEYGMDSVDFVALAKRISALYHIEFTPAVFYTSSSIAAISAYLLQHYPSAVAEIHHLSIQAPIAIKNHHQPVSKASTSKEEIAIIGMHGLFPQSDDLSAFWDHLIRGHDLVSEVPNDRWDWQSYYGDSKLNPHQTNSKWGGFINQADCFDASFFNISAREANLMDPQHRLFLETVWKTIEDAGYDPFHLPTQAVAVFAGVEFSEYQTLISRQQQSFHGAIATGNSHSMLANRVSYFFNFQGPSEAIDTACSSSLVAIHRAIQSIRQQECEMAVAGGVSLMLNPDTFVVTSQLGALSSEGRCKTFDESADGYVKGEGVGAILLKPLEQAQRDGDHIYGVIKASAVNHGGKAQSLTAPNAAAQRDLLIKAYRDAQLDPSTITYIETHGTGTALGDPVEIEGLKAAFHELAPTLPEGHIALGSVKTNIGHLEPASGIASVIKLLLAMSHETLPGLLHFTKMNPYIQLAQSPFYIAKDTQAWRRLHHDTGAAIPLRAGVSSFGFGGTNAHLVLEEGRPYQSRPHEAVKAPFYLMTLSAKHADSLQDKIIALQQWVIAYQDELPIASLAYTLNAGRAHFNYRCAWVVQDSASLIESLEILARGDVPPYGMKNEGQVFQMSGPVFDALYASSIQALAHPEQAEHYRHHLFILADLYTKHHPIEWQALYQTGRMVRLASLPSYPFKKTRHWFNQEWQGGVSEAPTVKVRSPKESDFTSMVLTYLRSIFAERLHISPDAIQDDETYEVYGVDSVMGLDITNRLERDLGTIPKTILYECNRLNDLAQYVMKHANERLRSLLSVPQIPPVSAVKLDAPIPTTIKQVSTVMANDDIAIIGLNGKFPMAEDLDTFWHHLKTGKDCVGEVPADRWRVEDYPVERGVEQRHFPHGGFITDVDQFDPLFFNISPRDAVLMDPQERLFMQSVWATLEDAGYTRDKLKQQAHNEVGVFAGVTYNYYPLVIAEEWQKGNRVPLDIQTFSIANRVSYFLNLTGPSLVIDTACSSSLAAIHLACESLLRGDCAMAIAGGVNLSLHPSKYHFLGSFSLLSEQGRCTSFAEGGTGYVPSEGVGAVLLKPLTDAIRDGDVIHGVIKGSSMNHGGKTSGYTVPNPKSQSAVILKALQRANIDPRTISYVEAHGTGTALGDPIEIRGLQDAYETYTQEKQFCAIGSVKSNIGHLESAAGISQLTKVLLQMRYRQLVPTLHAEHLNPFIDFEHSPFYVQRSLTDWETKSGTPRRAAVSSFGAGGANVHMIVESYEAPQIQKENIPEGPFIFLISAFNDDRLHAKVRQLQTFLANHETETRRWVRDLSYTLQTGRESMTARLAIMASTIPELQTALIHYLDGDLVNAWVNLHAQTSITAIDDTQGHSLEALAQAWVKGARVSWQTLYINQEPRLLTLPTYPFTKRRCWVSEQTTLSVEQQAHLSVVSQDTPQQVASKPVEDNVDWLYTTQWESQPRDSEPSTTKEGKWLIFSDKELGLLLQDTLGIESCVYCFSGDSYHQMDNQVYYINAQHQPDYDLLFQSVYAEYGSLLKGVIYISPPSDNSLSLLHLFKAMIPHQWSQSLTFCLVTQSAQAVLPTDTVQIWQHHLWSMTRIFAAEQASYQVVLLDVDPQTGLRQSAQHITKELIHPSSNQNHIAYRGEERYTIRLKQAVDLTPSEWLAPKAALVTGGLGALGYETAVYLAAKGTRYLLLTGATPLSETTTEKNAWMQSLIASGIHVIYGAVDVANKAAMQALIREAEATWKLSIDGVFHLAGVTTDNVPMAEMDDALWQQVLDVKIKGAMVLHELFLDVPISSFVLFSSIAAVPHFGMAGLSAYAAANAFLNGLAWYRRQMKLPAISINWVAWAEKGMSHRHSHDAFLDAVGMASLSIKQGMSLLNDILQLNPTEITVCHIQWQKFLQINAVAKQLDFFKDFSEAHARAGNQASLISDPKEAASKVHQLLASVLGLDEHEIDLDAPFQQYGMDSVIGIQFTAELGVYFPDVLSPMDLYRYPTLSQLTAFVVQHISIEEATTSSTPPVEEDISALNYEQLNALLEAELNTLEQTYD